MNTPRIVILGDVDHGKSTLAGKLFSLSASCTQDKIQKVRDACTRRQHSFEWAFLFDGLQEERDEGKTIQSTETLLRFTDAQTLILIDAPGHREFLKNMISGAADADTALLVISAIDGIGDQTQRHAILANFLNVDRFIVVINKLDQIEDPKRRFNELVNEFTRLSQLHNIQVTDFLPISAKEGIQLTSDTQGFSWYKGSDLLTLLLNPRILPPVGIKSKTQDLRFSVQGTFTRSNGDEILLGHVIVGNINRGDVLYFAPDLFPRKVENIEKWKENREFAKQGDCVGLRLKSVKNRPLPQRGQIAYKLTAPEKRSTIGAHLFELEAPISCGKFTLRLLAQEIECQVLTLSNAELIRQATIQSSHDLLFDTQVGSQKMCRFVLISDSEIVAGGLLRPN